MFEQTVPKQAVPKQTVPKQTVPDWLTGVWQRRSIEENGIRDTTTQVTWIQTRSRFGDIRIPADRVVAGLANCFEMEDAVRLVKMSDRNAIALSKQEGFAGVTQFTNGHCEWHRSLDYCPPTDQRDQGTLYWEGDMLIEVGPDNSYVEEWQRIATGPTAAMTVSRRTGLTAISKQLVICGDYFIYMCDRRPPLPKNRTLAELLETDTTGKISLQSKQALNCEVSLGRCTNGKMPWEIQQSTLPWKEDSCLWHSPDLSVDRQNNQVIQTIGEETVVWDIQEWGALERLLMTQPAYA